MPSSCPSCASGDLSGEPTDDGRIRTVCHDCGHEWMRGEAKRVYKTVTTIEDLRRRFPSPGDVRPEVVERVAALNPRLSGLISTA